MSVVFEHAQDAAMLWRLRERATRAPLYRLRHLEMLDDRVLAHLAGLQAAGPHGLDETRRALADANPGSVFVFAYLAFTLGDTESMRRVVQLALAEPAFMDALVAALAWLDLAQIEEPLRLLRSSREPAYRRLELAVRAAHRVAMDDALARAAADDDPLLRARALRAIGETKCLDLTPLLRRAINDDDRRCQFWAGWSLAIAGNTSGAALAYEVGVDVPALSTHAIEIAMRAGDREWARSVISALARDPSRMRMAIVAAGALGEAETVPWLLQLIERPQFARVAAEAFASITGVDLDQAEFKQDAPAEVPDEHDDDVDLRWPSPEGLAGWWQAEGRRFSSGERYLAGSAVSEAAAVDVLRRGYQRQRRGAAIELARLHTEMIFPVVARGDWQKRRLAS